MIKLFSLFFSDTMEEVPVTVEQALRVQLMKNLYPQGGEWGPLLMVESSILIIVQRQLHGCVYHILNVLTSIYFPIFRLLLLTYTGVPEKDIVVYSEACLNQTFQ
jgi:hypothetical protein